MAEILVRSHESWMDEVPQVEKDKWTPAMWAKYNRRRTIGNPISIRPDGSKWGKKECPPRYIIIKIPGMSVEAAQKYVEREYASAETKEIKHNRRYKFDISTINNCLANIATTKGIIITDKVNFENLLTDRTLEL